MTKKVRTYSDEFKAEAVKKIALDVYSSWLQSHFGRWIKTLMLAHLGLFFTLHLVLHFMC